MKTSSSIDLKPTHKLLDRREAERVPIHCPVTFTSDDGSEGTGTLRNLSKTGCQILSMCPPVSGSRITLTCYLPDGKPPVCLVGVLVCQVRGHLLGVKFKTLTGEERRRLQYLILSRVTLSDLGHQRAAFRVV